MPSNDEQRATDLAAAAIATEDAGFDYAVISDRLHTCVARRRSGRRLGPVVRARTVM